MVNVYARMLARSSVWGTHAADGVDHNEAQGIPACATHYHPSASLTTRVPHWLE